MAFPPIVPIANAQRKTPDSIVLPRLRPGKTIKADDVHAVAEAAKGDMLAMGGGQAKGFNQVGVKGILGGAPIQQGAWIRALSLDNAPRYSHMQIVDSSFNCGQVQVTVSKISNSLPREGVGFVCTNANYVLRAGQGGWVKYIALNRPRKGRIGRGRGVWLPKL